MVPVVHEVVLGALIGVVLGVLARALTRLTGGWVSRGRLARS